MNLGLRLFFGEVSFVDRIFFDMTRKNEVDSVMMLFSVIKKYPKIKKRQGFLSCFGQTTEMSHQKENPASSRVSYVFGFRARYQ